MVRYFILLFTFASVFIHTSCNKDKEVSSARLLDADAVYVSQRITVLTVDPEATYAEIKKILVDDLEAVVQDRFLYSPTGKAYVYQSGGSEGLLNYVDSTYSALGEYLIKIDPINNYIVDNTENGSDTIRDFVILADLNIIMSKANFDLFEQQKKKRPSKRGEIITFYRYK